MKDTPQIRNTNADGIKDVLGILGNNIPKPSFFHPTSSHAQEAQRLVHCRLKVQREEILHSLQHLTNLKHAEGFVFSAQQTEITVQAEKRILGTGQGLKVNMIPLLNDRMGIQEKVKQTQEE